MLALESLILMDLFLFICLLMRSFFKITIAVIQLQKDSSPSSVAIAHCKSERDQEGFEIENVNPPFYNIKGNQHFYEMGERETCCAF